jgi:hypothetical protein
MQVISLEEEAFYALVNKLVEQVKKQHGEQAMDKWIDTSEAMRMLRITSKTTLQKFRDEGKIRFSQPEKKLILYDRDSILEFIEKHAHEKF